MTKKFLYLCITLLSAPLSGKVILWDLGGVLFYPDKFGVAQSVGISNFVSYMVSDMRSPNIQGVLFNALELMEKPERGIREKAGTAEGEALPTIMCKWQAGTIKGPDIIKRSKAHIKHLHSIDFFESDSEMRLILKTIRAMFDPKILADNIYALDEGVQLLRDCRIANNKEGKRRHRNFAFSNWDPLSFDIFRAQNRYIFSLFDEIVISGHVGMIKPRPEIYEYLLKTYDLDPKDCLLIDDQDINAVGARKCGIQTILVKNGNFKEVRQKLKKLGIL